MIPSAGGNIDGAIQKAQRPKTLGVNPLRRTRGRLLAKYAAFLNAQEFMKLVCRLRYLALAAILDVRPAKAKAIADGDPTETRQNLVLATGGDPSGRPLFRSSASVTNGLEGRPIKVLACFLPNHLDRILVFADPEKDGLPESIIACPFREFDLADQDRLDPAAPLHFSSAQPGI
jgi:hypothetical protein